MRRQKKRPDYGYLPREDSKTISFGLIESSLSRRGGVDGEDEREIYWETCQSNLWRSEAGAWFVLGIRSK